MNHMLNSMTIDVSIFGENVCYSCDSNHMTHRGEWFKEMQIVEKPSYVEIGDDTAHSIATHTQAVYLLLCMMAK